MFLSNGDLRELICEESGTQFIQLELEPASVVTMVILPAVNHLCENERPALTSKFTH